jgi:hypothetical protein
MLFAAAVDREKLPGVSYESGNLDGLVIDRAAKGNISDATGGGACQLRRGRERGNGGDVLDDVIIANDIFVAHYAFITIDQHSADHIYTSHNIFPAFRQHHVG